MIKIFPNIVCDILEH